MSTEWTALIKCRTGGELARLRELLGEADVDVMASDHARRILVPDDRREAAQEVLDRYQSEEAHLFAEEDEPEPTDEAAEPTDEDDPSLPDNSRDGIAFSGIEAAKGSPWPGVIAAIVLFTAAAFALVDC